MAFSDRFLEELVERNDIVDVVSGYVSLTKRSGSNQFGLCPFHSEKTASFSVSAAKQMFYCFGCGKGGGVINFIMEMEALPFPDAVHLLAKRAGLPLPEDDRDDAAVRRRERILLANRDAARFFYSVLGRPEGAAAVAYINRRGISKEMVRRFGLGAAPDRWTALSDHLTGRGYTQEELLGAGLVKAGKNGVYDTFRNRLLFPVFDIRGNVLGFSGRILDDGTPKYLNSPDTAVFNKSRNLFGINLAKKSRAGYFLLVEGNIDVVALHQAGFDSAVAALGTAFTGEQARLMHRYTEEVVICFDGDTAGQKAANRAISILEKTGIRVRVLRMAGAKDPDELIRKGGPDAFQLLIDRRETHIEYQLLTLRQRYDLEQDQERVAFLQEAEGLLAGLQSDAELEVYGRRVAELTRVTVEGVKNDVEKIRKKRRAGTKRRMEREGTRPSRSMQPEGRDIRYENAYSAVAEQGVIRLLLKEPTLLTPELELTPESFSSPFLGRAFEKIRERILAGKENSLATLAPFFTQGEMGQLTKLLTQPDKLADARRSLEDYIEKIQTERLRQSPPDDLQNLQDIHAKYRKLKGVENQDGE